jgi:hypothetical protein
VAEVHQLPSGEQPTASKPIGQIGQLGRTPPFNCSPAAYQALIRPVRELPGLLPA